jgi:hypothetical protein
VGQRTRAMQAGFVRRGLFLFFFIFIFIFI